MIIHNQKIIKKYGIISKKCRQIVSIILTLAILMAKMPNNIVIADELSDAVTTRLAELDANSYPIGDSLGCYSQSAYQSFVKAITSAKNLSDSGTATTEQATAAIAAIDAAEEALKKSVVRTKDDSTYYMYRDFEDDTVGLYPYGIDLEALTNGATAKIVEEDGNKFFRLTTTSTASGKANMFLPYWECVTATGNQRVVVEFSVRFNEELRYANAYLARNQNAASATTIAFENANKQHKITIKKSGSSYIKPVDFMYSTWHDFVVVHNMDAQTYTVFMDGEIITEDYPFRTTGSTLLTGHVFGIDGFSNGKVDFDEFVVRVIDNENEVYNPKVKGNVIEVLPSTINSEGALVVSDSATYSVQVNAPVNQQVSLGSTEITVLDSSSKAVTVNLTNNLYYSNQTSSTGIYTQKVKIDYLVVDQDASNEYIVNAYDEKGNLLQGGQYFLVEENFEEEKLAVLEMDAIKLTTNGNQVVSAEKMSSTAFTYMCSGLLNEVFDLSDITGFKEFYYGDNLTNLAKCTQVILQKSGDEYVLLPVDSSGKPVSKSAYIVYDHLYTFDITLNSIVNEHSEDNGDVYLWRGSQYYITENLTPTTDDTLQYIDETLTEIQPYTVSVTGRIGDSFEVAEVDELLIYAAVGDRQTFIQDWVNLQKHPSDNGARYYDGYCINDYLHLNSFEDKVNYFAIYENSDGSVSLGAMLPGDHMYSIDMIDFYTTRQPIVKPPIMDAKNIYHIQLRVPSNAVIEMDGELYSGDLTLSGGSATVIYNDQVLADSAFSSVSSSGGQQESNSLTWAKNIVYGYNSSNVIYEPAFDPEVMKITITFMVYGTLTSTTGKEIVYSREEPLTVTETLSREKMLQSFFACPNLRGYDVLLDISAAVKKDVDATTAYNVTVTKNWDDSSNFYEVRPNEVTVTLERSLDNGVTWSEFENNVVTITGDGDNAGKSIWTKELTGIDSYIINGDGEIVPYTFRIKSESMVDTGNDDFIYESTINGTTVTNKLDFETELDIQLEKEWVDVNGNVLTGLVPDDVIVHIYQDGKYFSTEYLSAKNNWQSNVYGVPVYKNAKEKYEYTVKVVDEDEEIIEDGQIAAYNSKSFQFSTTDTNVSAGTKVLSLSQVYLQTRTITISNDVTKTFIETYDFTDDSVVFNYTASLKYGDISAVAEGYSSNVSYNEATGEYKFTLATGESAEIQVLDAYTFTVVEDEGNHDYTTTWQIDSGEVNEGRVAVIDYINANMNINFANDTTYYGDVEVQGFQMNTDYSEGAVSEKSPSFRVVSRACEKLKNAEGELLDVVAYGTIYALDEEVNSDYRGNMTLDKAVLANSDYVYSEEEFQEIFYYECKVGTYFGWTARELEDPYYRYYGLTFVMKSYNYATLKQDMTFRAYAKLSDGTIVYGTKIYKTRMYDIANNLYQSKKVGKKEGHEFLYRNVLNLVKMEENRVDICYAMLNAMQVPSTSDIRYTYVNNVNKDIVDYVYCQGKYNYADRQTVDREFVPKRLSEEQLTELLTELNSVRGTNYNNLFDWIYYETENYRDYQGFYKKVQYDWNDSIYNGTNKY